MVEEKQSLRNQRLLLFLSQIPEVVLQSTAVFRQATIKLPFLTWMLQNILVKESLHKTAKTSEDEYRGEWILFLSGENITDQKGKIILLRASFCWLEYVQHISPYKSSLFLDLLVCNQKRENFPCFLYLWVFLFFSLWLSTILFSCLTLLESFEPLQARIKTEYSRHKTEISLPVWQNEYFLRETSSSFRSGLL